MTILLDLILIIALGVFALIGYRWGIFQAVGALLGLVISSWLAANTHKSLGHALKPIFLNYCNLAKIIIFAGTIFLINRMFGFIFYLIEKKYQLDSILPFLKNINRAGGLIVGLIEGIIVLGLILLVTSHYLGEYEWVNKILASSKITNWLTAIVKNLKPLLPKF